MRKGKKGPSQDESYQEKVAARWKAEEWQITLI
jgi:hypothetical protein